MFGFRQKRTFEHPELGRFRRVRTMWYSSPQTGKLTVSVEGDRTQPSPDGIEVARRLLQKPDQLIQAAEAFVMTDPQALEFMEGSGSLVCDGFTVHVSGNFAVEFSLTNWPDAMITVPFEDGVPCDISLGD